MDEKGKSQLIKKVFEKDAKTRGILLIYAITIEMLIADIVSIHYCPDEERRHSMYSSVLRQLNFRAKIDIFKKILQTYYLDIFKQYKENFDIFKKIKAIQELRNTLAHSMSNITDSFLEDYSEDSSEDYIPLVNYKRNGKKEIIKLTKTKINNEINNCTSVIIKLNIIQEKIKRRCCK